MSTGLTTPVSGASLRPLVLTHRSLEHTFMVPSALYANCTQLRDQFQATLDPELDLGDAAELVSDFLGFAAKLVDEQPGPFDDILSLILNEFESRFLVGNDVHTVAGDLDVEDPDKIVKSYFMARQAADRPIRPHVSALLRAAEEDQVRLHAIFGGQGTSEDYFDELVHIYETYPSIITPFLEMASSVLRALVSSPDAAKVHALGLNFIQWLTNPETRPNNEYLVSAPVSVPIIGVIQLAHYVVTCTILGISPGQFAQYLRGATGHSQGIVTALLVATGESWQDFSQSTVKGLTMLFFIGLRSQQAFPNTALLPSVLQDSVDAGEGVPTPMLSVRDLELPTLERYIAQTNKFLPEDRHVAVALVNGPKSFVVSGPPMSLYGLNRSLRAEKVDTSANQGRVPHSKRKLRISNRFLPITSPFHSHLLKSATELICEDIANHGAGFEASELKFGVFDTFDGSDLRESADLTRRAVELITELPVRWELATAFPRATHILDFGPGGISGISALTHRNKDGTGTRVIVAGVLGGRANATDDVGYKQEIFNRSTASVVYAPNWVEKFSPKLVRTSHGTTFVDTKFSRLLGRPHLMVPGMVPATVKPEVVAATLNAGYHVELGGGGYFSPAMLQSALEQIQRSTKPGVGITLNVLYVNPVMLQWCLPLVQRLRADGFPVEGLTIGAGVPSPEVGSEYIRTLGLRHISFKPGTVDSILAAVKIAEENPTFPVIIQWTGGRGGGHHSFEDFHQPILATYSRIRKHDNIILVAGSGFGDAEGTYPYLTGAWSVEFNYPPMPFDGFLFGSRMMVAKEFATSPAVKRAIVEAAGVPDRDWEGTYEKATGGVITVMSEMGEPIHKIATRGVLLWKELDDTIFSLPKAKRLPELLKRKTSLIGKLNKDSQKPWFGRKASGTVADLDDMTYAEVLERLVELLYVASESRWIDVSLRNMTGAFAKRIEERFTRESAQESVIQNMRQLDSPTQFIETLLKRYPEASEQVINTQDRDFFLMLCLEPRKKPVPFIPVLDDDFEYYFKKDSLWQSQDLAAVVDQDVGRTCILQSPVSVRYSTVVDEPVKDILDNINRGHMERLLAEQYGGDESKVPVIETFGNPVAADTHDLEFTHGVTISRTGSVTTYSVDRHGELPDEDEWLAALAGGDYNWRYAVISNRRIVQNQNIVPNALRAILAPARGAVVEIANPEDAARTVLSLYEPVNGTGRRLVFQLSYDAASQTIKARLREHRTFNKKPADLELQYKYAPETGYAPISEVMDDRNARIKAFYWLVWFGDAPLTPLTDLTASWTEGPVEISRSAVKDFVHAVGNFGEAYVDLPGKTLYAPMDFAIVLGWKAIIKAIFPAVIDGDLLRLVHLSNGFEMVPGAAPLAVGDAVTTEARIKSVLNTAPGKVIEVQGTLSRAGSPVMKVTSQFLYRGKFDDYNTTFSIRDENPIEISLDTPKDVAILCSKEWFHPASAASAEDAKAELLGKTLTFRLQTTVKYATQDVFSEVVTEGQVVHVLPTKEIVEVGSVRYEAGQSYGNPVVDYLERTGRTIEQPANFERPHPLSQTPLAGRAPASNELYGEVSGDFNPIHVSPVFANYAGLPGTITHGMFTSANIRAQVETWAADNHIGRVRAYSCKFVGMVLPNDLLDTRLEHVGMVNGRKLVKVQTVKRETGDAVLEAKAEIDQPTTAYLFTGQGSQEQGMGMQLYESSAVARAVWDRADKHFKNTYGISILHIVRNNPPELTVYFGGESGKRIRENYISMMFETIDPETGALRQERIFKEIDDATDHYTFVSPNGVLAMTQFTQPALTLMEKAYFEDMKARGLVSEESMFAGHSLGEYAALASLADVMPVESLVDIVFYRGMTMQVAVPRDEKGRSNYGMVAVNPSRVHATFSDEALRLVIDEIGKKTQWLLEIVNFNVANQQYVAAGDLRGLDTLTNVLNLLKIKKVNIVKLQEMMSEDEIKAYLAEIIGEVAAKSQAKPQPIELERGFAVIPLPGISVPFHSSYLRSGVNPFKNFLIKRVSKNAVKPASLVGKYIPNLTAKPFEVSKAYFEEVYELTGSAEIKRIIDDWERITA